ncbi:MAG: PAC2 family protein, partial [Actinobacteria bacterium]|nr:PAC2 family protein [Actinomycetota bacterium]
SYEGSTGILGILQDLAIRRGIDAISLWASIPHYASASPSPKAILAMINTLEDILEIPLPIGDLLNQSRDWEESVNELAEEDSEVGDYVRQLEASKDAEGLPEATGDSIAKEFERYFRRGTTE